MTLHNDRRNIVSHLFHYYQSISKNYHLAALKALLTRKRPCDNTTVSTTQNKESIHFFLMVATGSSRMLTLAVIWGMKYAV